MIIADDIILVAVIGGFIFGSIGSVIYVKSKNNSKSLNRVRNVVVREIKSVKRYEQTLSASQQNNKLF